MASSEHPRETPLQLPPMSRQQQLRLRPPSLQPALARPLLRPLLLLTLLQEVRGEADCTLVSLILRFQDSPIDLDPSFRPDIHSYKAKLDWSFSAFSVDARPDTGCEVDDVPMDPTEVPIGGSQKLTLYARHPDTGAKREYVVTAYRRLGSETELRSLEVHGGELSPVFSERHRQYDVRLELGRDVARIIYGLMDNEQRIATSAQEEHPTGAGGAGATAEGSGSGEDENKKGNATGNGADGKSGDTEGGGGGGGARLLAASSLTPGATLLPPQGGRRLAAQEASSGEVQFRTAYADFLLDVGFSRTVQLTVQCADPTQASIGTYTLHVSRPGCTPARPYFDPEKKKCVNFCSSGYYRNRQTHRCSRCNENCKICSGLLNCNMCTPDTEDYNYVIEPDGKCRAIANHLFRKYRWWCAGLGVLLFFLVLIGCCGLVQLCCAGTGGKSGRFSRLQDSDTDDDVPRYGGGGRFARY